MKVNVYKYFFYVTSCSTTMMLLLRRTLVLLNMLEHLSTVALFNAKKIKYLIAIFCCSSCLFLQAQRQDILLNNHWKTIANDTNINAHNGFEKSTYPTEQWKLVNVPHNWDAYEGYRRMLHGNKHGYAWYKKTFIIKEQKQKRYFLFFEGVGSYATVWLNGKQVGTHAGGRTSFTIDITASIVFNKLNHLAVRADHPAFNEKLPWVCGGCSNERGFSEGSQPMGIFRPIHLIVTNNVRVEPFGVHVWNNDVVTEKAAIINVCTQVKNYSNQSKKIQLLQHIQDAIGTVVAFDSTTKSISPNTDIEIAQVIRLQKNIHLWNLEKPYLYNVVTKIYQNNVLIDEVKTPYGIRSIKWDKGNSNRFFLNGKPVFLNGIAEYEHMLGNSHAFANEQIQARVSQIKSAGFNAFRDAHHPHHLLYQQLFDAKGLLWWTQMSAHVWYNTPSFKNNFKTLLKEWVVERRNSPSLILWGLQNESKLPADFAKECSDIIRQLDPTASSQRLITTCNGGEGTDWNVPQNWSGTYGGNPNLYGEELKKQLLVGEYGAWRTIDLHSEDNSQQNNTYSEDRFASLMMQKAQLAEQVKDSVVGHFHWLFSSHDNPGRVQGGEGFRTLDRIGPVNYKGLFTSWDEPTDAYYLYRSLYADKHKQPMVYIPMHTWSNRWQKPGIKNNIVIYSNCDEVTLYNGDTSILCTKQKRQNKQQLFVFNNINVQYNTLIAIGYVNGKVVAKDEVIIYNFPSFIKPKKQKENSVKSTLNYLYRVNCGGNSYTDVNGDKWLADNTNTNASYYSTSWTNQFGIMPAAFASQRNIQSNIKGTADATLYRSIRYGKHQLAYHFKVPDGTYFVELYFVEPWFGLANINATGWRVFDVAINNQTVIKDLDIYKEVGTHTALKKIVKVNVKAGELVVHFPNVKSSQAVIAAIAIAAENTTAKHTVTSSQNVLIESNNGSLQQWLSIGDTANSAIHQTFFQLPSFAFGADYLVKKSTSLQANIHFAQPTDVYVADTNHFKVPLYLKEFEKTSEPMILSDSAVLVVYKKNFLANQKISIPNEQSIGSIFFQPTTNIQPAFDLKPILSYRPQQAIVSDKIVRSQANGKNAFLFTTNNESSINWSVQIGAADVYSITIRYANETQETLLANLAVYAEDGTCIKTEKIVCTPSKMGKFNYATTNTNSMINAGKYTIEIKPVNAVNLAISGVDIQ